VNNLVRTIPGRVWRWVCFLAWLPWFAVSMPWQLQRAYGRITRAFDLGDWRPDEEHIVQRLMGRRSAHRTTPYRDPRG
jgi:hypothetical protein